MKITLVAGYGSYYRPCCICAKGFETGNPVIMAYIASRWLGYVCSTCLQSGAKAMQATLLRRGDELLALANEEIECPSVEDWQT